MESLLDCAKAKVQRKQEALDKEIRNRLTSYVTKQLDASWASRLVFDPSPVQGATLDQMIYVYPKNNQAYFYVLCPYAHGAHRYDHRFYHLDWASIVEAMRSVGPSCAVCQEKRNT